MKVIRITWADGVYYDYSQNFTPDPEPYTVELFHCALVVATHWRKACAEEHVLGIPVDPSYIVSVEWIIH